MNREADQACETGSLMALRRAWGPFAAEWHLHPDRLEIRSSGPTGLDVTTIDLSQIDTVATYQEPPRRLLLLSSGLLVLLALRLASGAGWFLWSLFFGLATLTGFLARGGEMLRMGFVQVETVGGRRFRLLGACPGRPEVNQFLAMLRHSRSRAIHDLRPGWQLEDGGFLEEPGEGEVVPGDDGPIDPRWIN